MKKERFFKFDQLQTSVFKLSNLFNEIIADISSSMNVTVLQLYCFISKQSLLNFVTAWKFQSREKNPRAAIEDDDCINEFSMFWSDQSQDIQDDVNDDFIENNEAKKFQRISQLSLLNRDTMLTDLTN